MTVEERMQTVMDYLKKQGYADRVIYFHNEDVTAESTADALNVEVDRICKGLAFRGKNCPAIVVLASGLARVDNHKFKEQLGVRPTMLASEQCEELIGQVAGTINPFYLNEGVRLYLDMSILKHKDKTVFPGIGDTDHVVELTIPELEKLTHPICWVNVTK